MALLAQLNYTRAPDDLLQRHQVAKVVVLRINSADGQQVSGEPFHLRFIFGKLGKPRGRYHQNCYTQSKAHSNTTTSRDQEACSILIRLKAMGSDRVWVRFLQCLGEVIRVCFPKL